ncbi:PEP-CTERM sorting domain-containing protein [Paucibacter sp. PLA-PC-4]|uniref:PEP-CTERM sorting domain-containing protein n=1 Tax=Paucibacter sp. PLA-PC-4 TaxID=2993655 RepID=UPI0022487885|nr:PEP-CTERM sorting domain-containing protein [Paucibacter sp. PLA-PC-4]MCX2862795.1 PEP-CTERM sorting domain-containing protein [Paucibacter sp. PLA-PC-4]
MTTLNKTLILSALAAASAIGGAQAATTLGQTDFAFTGVNGNTTVGGWSFVSFVDISAGTTIYFTDTNVLQTSTSSGVFSTSAETFWSWTAAADVAAGTSVALLGTGVNGQYAARSGAAGGVANGTVSNLNGGASNISSGGDILYAFQASSYASNYAPSAITFLGAIANRATPYASSDNPFSATGLSGIQVREYRMNNATTRYTQFTAQTSSADTPFASMDELRAALAEGANWSTIAESNSTPIVADVLAVTTVPEPSSYALLLAGLGVVGAMAQRRRR